MFMFSLNVNISYKVFMTENCYKIVKMLLKKCCNTPETSISIETEGNNTKKKSKSHHTQKEGEEAPEESSS